MTLHDDWKHILQHAWSVKWMFLAGVFDVGSAIAPAYITAVPIWVFAGLTLVCTMGGIWARILCQPTAGL